jgi:hypothetical protein
MKYPGAVWRPGTNAGYRAGRNSMETAVCHYTVGRNSRPIGDRGFFQFLISRDGEVTQFAEADAVCWHAGDPWNRRGPGIEIEYLDEDTIFTDAQLEACADLIAWLPIPEVFYDGPRVGSHVGFITHRSLLQSGDAHHDYWPEEDWAAMTAPVVPVPAPPVDTKKELDMELIVHNLDDDRFWYFPPFCHVPEWIEPAWKDKYAAAGIPVGKGDTQLLEGMKARRAEFRAAFVAEIADAAV